MDNFPRPSIGRIVHYVSDGNHFPAIVTEVSVDRETVDLVFFDAWSASSQGVTFAALEVKHAPIDATGQRSALDGTWHWPERE